jgi:integrase
MRFCDVKDLTFGNFDFANRLITYEQNKTKGHSSKSGVTLPLTDELLGLIGEQPESREKGDLVFMLPSHTMCLKALRRWTKRAGIDKHITWHCARHSFGTNMAATAAQKGISIRVVQDLMGHSNLRYTERYTRVMDEQKKAAMAELSKMMEG